METMEFTLYTSLVNMSMLILFSEYTRLRFYSQRHSQRRVSTPDIGVGRWLCRRWEGQPQPSFPKGGCPHRKHPSRGKRPQGPRRQAIEPRSLPPKVWYAPIILALSPLPLSGDTFALGGRQWAEKRDRIVMKTRSLGLKTRFSRVASFFFLSLLQIIGVTGLSRGLLFSGFSSSFCIPFILVYL